MMMMMMMFIIIIIYFFFTGSKFSYNRNTGGCQGMYEKGIVALLSGIHP